jgi:hypothetical protein
VKQPKFLECSRHPNIELLTRTEVEGRFVVTEKGNLSKFLQKSVGDVLLNSDEKTVWAIEIKNEETKRHGNLFLETWSNCKWFTPGWMFTLQCDLLFYYFQDVRELYVIPFENLRDWAFRQPSVSAHRGRLFDFPEKCQVKREQLNDTWGRCVPIDTIENEVKGVRKYKL